jgi:UDP-N-acetylglucosamine 1-carboxyvinyltransferase
VPLSGEITPQSNKNEALPVLAAACLTDEPVVFDNLPAIPDVPVMQQILRTLGVRVESSQGHCTGRASNE